MYANVYRQRQVLLRAPFQLDDCNSISPMTRENSNGTTGPQVIKQLVHIMKAPSGD